nr:HDOD domain-containing protein [Shewanella gelidii]
MFYNLLFVSQGRDSGGIANSLERQVMHQVESALLIPEDIAANILKLPTQAMALNNLLADDNVDIKDVILILQRDPVLSAEILKLCNTSLFRRNEKEVTSIQQAVVQLGRTQLRRLITTCSIKQTMEIKPIYFRRFGAQIWRHSMQVAYLCGELAEADVETAYVVGLLHDVGKIAIFKMLLDTFAQASPNEQPESRLFKQVMTTKSLLLSAKLTECWDLPSHFSSVLIQLVNADLSPDSPMAKVVWRANLISEASMLKQENKLSEGQLNDLLNRVELSYEHFCKYHHKLQQM